MVFSVLHLDVCVQSYIHSSRVTDRDTDRQESVTEGRPPQGAREPEYNLASG